MTSGSRHVRGAAAGLMAAGLALAPAAAARAATAQAGFTGPSRYEWWFANWQVQQDVWPLTEGAGVTVAVLDTGVQASVPDLRGVVLPGGDMTGAGTSGQTDFNLDPDGHGTAVAVLIAGQGYGTGTVGLSPRAKILPVAVTDGTVSSLNDSETLADGIRFAVGHGAQVINLSLGLPPASAASCDPVVQDAVAYALEHNVVVVAGSGDLNKRTGPVQPASCAGVLAVGGIEADGSLWQNSTRAPYVAVTAPADQMPWSGRDGVLHLNAYGTSFSAPLVSAAAALIRSRYPSMPWYRVDQRITGTAIPAGGPVPNDGYGYGIMDLPRAVNTSAYPVPASAPNPVYARFQAWLASPAGQSYTRENGGAAAGTPAAASQPGASGPAILAGVVAAITAAIAILVILMRTRRRSSGGAELPPRRKHSHRNDANAR